MHTPYTSSFGDAVAVAGTSAAAVLSAVVWRRPPKSIVASVLLFAAIWLAAISPFEAKLLTDLGATLSPEHTAFVLALTRVAVVLAFVIAPPRLFALPVAVGTVGLWKIAAYLKESDAEIAVLHVAFFAAAYAIHVRLASRPASPAVTPSRMRRHALHDTLLFSAATTLGGIVCVYVLERFCNSGDEWAYTYQADLFAHFKAYGEVPSCPGLFQNYWVFFYLGRAFTQYTPGWPLVMAPFQRLGIGWLASPFVFGALCVAIARLARRAAAADPTADEKQIAWAGTIAGLSALLPVGMLLNAGSRFSHMLVAACFAWAAECVCAIATADTSRRAQWLWGAGLGVATSLMVATRYPDGSALGVGIFVVFVYWLVRRRIGWRAFVATTLAFGAIAALSLVILRLQLGEWFKTGYSIADQYFSFAKPVFSMPKPNEFKYGVPLGTGSYMWWPCAPAFAVAGFLLARGRGIAIGFMTSIGPPICMAMYAAIEFGRGWDSGYGPRYNLPSVVPMAIGGGLLLAPVVRDAVRRHGATLRRAGPAVLATAAIVAATFRIAPLIYPEAHFEVHERDGTLRAIADASLKQAVVTVKGGEVGMDPLDLTQNLPSQKNPDVLILLKTFGPDWECGRKKYADRQWYRAVGKTADVKLEPE